MTTTQIVNGFVPEVMRHEKNRPMSGDCSSKVSSPGRLSKPSHVSEPPTVSGPMVDAGVAVLWASGAVEGQLGSDELLVAEIFQAMAMASPSKKG